MTISDFAKLVVRPRTFTPGELSAELGRRLSTEERKLVVNPLEITPEITSEAQPFGPRFD